MPTFYLRSWVAAQDADIRHRPVQPDQAQKAQQEPDRLPSGHAEEDRHRQAGLDGLQTILGSNQIVSDPHCRNASLSAEQFVVLYLIGAQLLMPPSYHAGFMQ